MTATTTTSGLTTPTLTPKATSAISTASQPAGAGSATTDAAASKLGANQQTFLNLLMTQIKNQDPTSPMDTNQFTTELVQFSSVEQQINTNASLTSLIQLTQSGQLLQSSSLVGHQVQVNDSSMPVQGGVGKMQFTASVAQPVTITVYNANGAPLRQDIVNAVAGTNSWTWNAATANGRTVPDGAYKVTATTPNGTSAVKPVPFSVVGTATGLTKSGNTMNLQLGDLSTDVANVQRILN